jgi:hypothetical protein
VILEIVRGEDGKLTSVYTTTVNPKYVYAYEDAANP